MRLLTKIAMVLISISFLAFATTGCSTSSSKQASSPADNPDVSGTVVIDETQVMLILGGSFGGGTLNYQGKTHKFSANGLKLGGIGMHKIDLTGDVYKLNNLKDFEGTYFSAEAGITVVKGVGGFWMKNGNGVTIHLKSKAEGLALSVGIEGMSITFK